MMFLMSLIGYSILLHCSQSVDSYSGGSGLETLSDIATWSCLETEAIFVQVVIRINESGFDAQALRLLDSSCKPQFIDQYLEWIFTANECGSRVLAAGQFRVISNVLSLWYDSGEYDMAITCAYPISDSGFHQNMDQTSGVVVPRLRWALLPISNEGTNLADVPITFKPSSSYIGDWKEGGSLMVMVETEITSVLMSIYGGESIVLTLVSCSLHFVHTNGSKSKPVHLLEQGCPMRKDSYFGESKAFDINSVGFVFNLLDEVRQAAFADVKHAVLMCSATVCKQGYVHGYEKVPKCQTYYYPSFCDPIGKFNSSMSVNFTSGLLTVRKDRTYSEDTNVTLTATLPDTINLTKLLDVSDTFNFSTVATTTSVGGHDSDIEDERIDLEPVLVAAICVGCFICGCAIIGVIWLLVGHKCRSERLTNVSSSSSFVQEQSTIKYL
ncbi:uncharacterized protein LOC134191663 isoform X2 [Corticium candelabrum]|uniref:uncharacterized protein LOC134191663 isoform X2 n=1 Tax=Corticium candelabrum TaxID=121492 RepID=UPI002E25517D|nr:uncharacterized protein LOC134191663 isoform X2 [Corticium candelabrum]